MVDLRLSLTTGLVVMFNKGCLQQTDFCSGCPSCPSLNLYLYSIITHNNQYSSLNMYITCRTKSLVICQFLLLFVKCDNCSASVLHSCVVQNALLILIGGDTGEADVVRPAAPIVPTDNQDLLDLLGNNNLIRQAGLCTVKCLH